MGHRAKNGMGSIRKRKDGTWEGRFSTPDGRQRSVYGKDSKTVSVKLRAAQVKAASGPWQQPSKITVDEWLDIWLTEYKSGLAPTTIDIYRATARRICASCGNVRLRDLMPRHIARLSREIRDAGYSIGVQRNTLVIFGAALKQAKLDGLIDEPPATPLPRKQEKPLVVIDRPNFAAFLAAAEKTAYGNAVVFLLLTGLRIGELRGLLWSDIDMEAGIMHVRRQIGRLNGNFYETTPKRDEQRDIALPADAVRILQAQKIRQAEDRLKAGAAWIEDDLSAERVFRQHSGRHLTQAALAPSFETISEVLGIHVTPHTLRHSNAVAALRSGVDPKTVQHNLGHRSAAMTLDVYARYTSDAGVEGAKKLDNFWVTAINQGDN